MVRRTPGQILAVLLALVALSSPSVADTVLLDFSSPTCGPCRRMRPIVQRLINSGVAVREVDVSRETALAQQFRIQSVPTFIVLVDGQQRARLEGATSHRQLVEMIAKSEQIAAGGARVRGQSPDALAPVQLGGAPSRFDGGADLQSPQAGRIVELEPPADFATTPRRTPPQPISPRPGNPFPSAAAAPPAGSYANLNALTTATVRLSVDDPAGKSTGTGTIVDARSGQALVLTCGHIFRESQGKGRIEVTLFDAGPQGAIQREAVAGELIDYDLERDLALVGIWINAPVQVSPIAPAKSVARPSEPVTTMGCSGGADPTPQQTRVTTVDRYAGHPNVQVSGAPVEGRSGGGLFNAAGQIVGVCFAADPQANEGLYAGLPSIHAKLDELGLSAIYQQPSTSSPPVRIASNAGQEPQVRGQDPGANFPVAPTVPMTVPATPESSHGGGLASTAPLSNVPGMNSPPMGLTATTPTAGALSPVEQATLEELANRGGASEVICIIRPQQPGGKSEVITVSGASPAFVGALQNAAANAGPVRR